MLTLCKIIANRKVRIEHKAKIMLRLLFHLVFVSLLMVFCFICYKVSSSILAFGCAFPLCNRTQYETRKKRLLVFIEKAYSVGTYRFRLHICIAVLLARATHPVRLTVPRTRRYAQDSLVPFETIFPFYCQLYHNRNYNLIIIVTKNERFIRFSLAGFRCDSDVCVRAIKENLFFLELNCILFVFPLLFPCILHYLCVCVLFVCLCVLYCWTIWAFWIR